jgi:hypothetical protein
MEISDDRLNTLIIVEKENWVRRWYIRYWAAIWSRGNWPGVNPPRLGEAGEISLKLKK